MGLFSKKSVMTVRIPGMNCGHCEGKVSSALTQVSGIDKFTVDLPAKTVSITLAKKEPADFEAVQHALTEAGYPGEQA